MHTPEQRIDASAIENDPTAEAAAQLMRRYREGDPNAFNDLVRLHQNLAVGYAFYICGNRELAEDLVQEAWIQVMEVAHKFDANRSFVRWFNTIISQVYCDHMRAKNQRIHLLQSSANLRDPSLADSALVDTSSDPSKRVLRVDQVRHALGVIGEKFADVLWSKLVDEKSADEIAAELDMQPSSIYARLSTGQLKFRQAYLGELN